MGARPGSLDREKRTLTGQRGRINKNTGAQAAKSSVNQRPCGEAGRYLVQKKAFYKGGPIGVRPRPADTLEGSRLRGKAFYKGGNGLNVPAGIRPRPADALEGNRLRGKESSSPDPKSGEQWTPFGKVNLLPGGKRIQGVQKPSTVL